MSMKKQQQNSMTYEPIFSEHDHHNMTRFDFIYEIVYEFFVPSKMITFRRGKSFRKLSQSLIIKIIFVIPMGHSID